MTDVDDWVFGLVNLLEDCKSVCSHRAAYLCSFISQDSFKQLFGKIPNPSERSIFQNLRIISEQNCHGLLPISYQWRKNLPKSHQSGSFHILRKIVFDPFMAILGPVLIGTRINTVDKDHALH